MIKLIDRILLIEQELSQLRDSQRLAQILGVIHLMSALDFHLDLHDGVWRIKHVVPELTSASEGLLVAVLEDDFSVFALTSCQGHFEILGVGQALVVG
jgi:hypothetical protein